MAVLITPRNTVRTQLKSTSYSCRPAKSSFVPLRGTPGLFVPTTSIPRFPLPVGDFAIEWVHDYFRQSEKRARIVVDTIHRSRGAFGSQAHDSDHRARPLRLEHLPALVSKCRLFHALSRLFLLVETRLQIGPAATSCMFVSGDSPCWPVWAIGLRAGLR